MLLFPTFRRTYVGNTINQIIKEVVGINGVGRLVTSLIGLLISSSCGAAEVDVIFDSIVVRDWPGALFGIIAEKCLKAVY